MRHSALIYSLRFIVPAACGVILAACGDQAPADYQGEPLAVIRGTLTSQLPDPLPDSDIVLGWPDQTKGDAESAPFGTFVRGQLSATFPASFSLEILQRPPESAYLTRPTTGPSLVGPRLTTAIILLAKHDVPVTSSSVNLINPTAGPVIASFDAYMLTYAESDGTLSLRVADGSIYPISHVTKGFHLVRQDRSYCSNGVDQSCLDLAKMFHPGLPPSAWETYSCSNAQETTIGVDVPLDTPMDLTIPSPDAPPPALTPCSPPSG